MWTGSRMTAPGSPIPRTRRPPERARRPTRLSADCRCDLDAPHVSGLSVDTGRRARLPFAGGSPVGWPLSTPNEIQRGSVFIRRERARRPPPPCPRPPHAFAYADRIDGRFSRYLRSARIANVSYASRRRCPSPTARLISIEGGGVRSSDRIARGSDAERPARRSTSRALPDAKDRKDHARGAEAAISHPCSMLVLARGNRLWRPALPRAQGNAQRTGGAGGLRPDLANRRCAPTGASRLDFVLTRASDPTMSWLLVSASGHAGRLVNARRDGWFAREAAASGAREGPRGSAAGS